MQELRQSKENNEERRRFSFFRDQKERARTREKTEIEQTSQSSNDYQVEDGLLGVMDQSGVDS